MKERRIVKRFAVAEPATAAARSLLCGYDQRRAEEYWQKHAGDHATFFIAGASGDRPDTVRLWDHVRKVTGDEVDITPQPTGNCVAASAEEAVECLQCAEIVIGDAEEFRPLFNPFTYAVGRVLIGGNQLRGQPGAVGGQVAKGLEKYGSLEVVEGLPKYNKANVDAWGDDKKVDGVSFRDFMEKAAAHVVKSTARVQQMSELLDGLASLYPATIASMRGYEMEAGRDGFHDPSGSWSHQMGIWGYSISKNWIAIKNQWGDVHGEIRDPETGELWPPGFIKARLDQFEKGHFRGAETIVYSSYQGFPQRRYDHSRLA